MKQYRLLLDMDEVLVDFVSGALATHNVTREAYESEHLKGAWDITPTIGRILGRLDWTLDDFWEPIHDAGPEFWLCLQPFPWFTEIIGWAEKFREWYIVTSPSRNPNSVAGKVAWLQSNFGGKFNRYVITRHKHLLANKDSILVDDRESTVSKFCQYGGKAILFPTNHNSLFSLREDPMKHVFDAVD